MDSMADLDWSRVAWTGSRYIDVLEPDPGDIILEEVAVGLSRQTRFGGAATSRTWSVLHHSILCLHYAEQDHKFHPATLLAILLHDGPEYILRDLPAPVKNWCPDYTAIEANWARAFAARFGASEGVPSLVKRYDLLALASEKEAFISRAAGAWPGLPEPRDIPLAIADMAAHEAVDFFCRKVNKLSPAIPGGEQPRPEIFR